MTLGVVALHADVVELQDGTRIEGTILAENPDSIEIEIGANERGTIRRVLIIDASEIRTWMADKANRSTQRNAGEVNRLGSREYIERLIREAQQKTEAGELDAGIEAFGHAADLAAQDIESMEPAKQVELMELRAHATRLQLAALKGKEHMLEESVDGVEDKLEDMQKDLERDIEEYRRDLSRHQEAIIDDPESRFGSSAMKAELDRREEELKRRQTEFVSLRQRTLERLRQKEEELAQTVMRMELAEERVDKAEDDAKRVERSLRR
jgi:hypothetical protein